MKPDWKNAPEWANYLAMDADGEWYWYQKEPADCDGVWFGRDGEELFAGKTDLLEKRPITE